MIKERRRGLSRDFLRDPADCSPNVKTSSKTGVADTLLHSGLLNSKLYDSLRAQLLSDCILDPLLNCVGIDSDANVLA